MRKIVHDFFWFCGHKAHCFGNAESAFAALKKNPPDIVIIGSTPGMDRKALITALRQERPGIPVISIVGPKEEGFTEAGMEMVLGRPIDLKGLMDAVSSMLDIPRPHP